MLEVSISETNPAFPIPGFLNAFTHQTACGRFILSKPTPAFERVGLLSNLPSGAELEVTGEGFNDRTVKVKSNGTAYTVFWRDLEDCVDDPAFLYS